MDEILVMISNIRRFTISINSVLYKFKLQIASNLGVRTNRYNNIIS